MSKEVKVPDIGDFTDVEIIEVHVQAGDDIHEEDAIVTLETDKASMEVPSPASGKVGELKVKVGDRVSEGSVLLLLEGGEA
ncbi:MAG: dihydrolipoamide acetyltransferase, partial [Rhodocyclaceae bacterium]|nr:dihydrolipoamide acetyltransferase [Rhodocyclaceae bacterium]